jgi:hypothetical protein
VLDQDEGRWLTYAEAGQLLGISPEAVRQLARRRGWSRRTPNAYGVQARVLVPENAIVRPRPGLTAVQLTNERGMPDDGVHPDEQQMSGLDRLDESGVRAFEAADLIRILRETMEGLVTPLRDQLVRAEQRADADRIRADRAERHLEEERKRVDEERKRVDHLQAALADAVAAERIAAGEAAALRAELDRRQDWRAPRWRRWFR